MDACLPAGAWPGGATAVDPRQVIDQVFDFAAMMLNAQREFAKQLVATSTAAAGSLKNAK